MLFLTYGDSMKLIKNILKSSKEIIITYLLSYLIIIISCLIYTILGHHNLDKFLNNTCSYILLLFYFLTIIYLLKKNYQKEPSLPIKNYFSLILLGTSIATLFNMIYFYFYLPPKSSTIPILLAIISSGIIGPIYEEILFRYLLYNRLKKHYSLHKSKLITTIIFALIHLNPIKIIYAFILGYILNINYEYHHNIIAPILIHISANIIVIFLFEYNTYILLLSIINLLVSIKLNFTTK